MQDNHGLYCLILTSIEKEVMYFVKDMESTCQPMKTIHNCYRFNFITITSTMTRIIDMNAIFNILSYFNTILSEYSAAKESIDIALSSFIVKTDRSSSPPPFFHFSTFASVTACMCVHPYPISAHIITAFLTFRLSNFQRNAIIQFNLVHMKVRQSNFVFTLFQQSHPSGSELKYVLYCLFFVMLKK